MVDDDMTNIYITMHLIIYIAKKVILWLSHCYPKPSGEINPFQVHQYVRKESKSSLKTGSFFQI